MHLLYTITEAIIIKTIPTPPADAPIINPIELDEEEDDDEEFGKLETEGQAL